MISQKISDYCLKALLDEALAAPKPGLVDRLSNGAHRDMDVLTFIRSAHAVAPYFAGFFEAGSRLEAVGPDTLKQLRPLGVACEQAMFAATKGVNTHKGAIFSLSLLCAAAGFCYARGKGWQAEAVCECAACIAGAALSDFDRGAPATAGEKLYAAYGVTGIRGEAASGFRSVREVSLPAMKALFEQGEYARGEYSKNDVYVHVLLLLAANVVDTNVIARCGMEAVDYVRHSALAALALGGMLTAEGRQAVRDMDRDFTEKNISPGGCADLLGVTILLHGLETLWEETARDILAAREARWNRRLLMTRRHGHVLVTITICLPVFFRIERRFDGLFEKMLARVFDFFEQNQAGVIDKETERSADGPAAYLLMTGSAYDVKRICIRAEEELIFGRILDIDVMDESGGPVGRAELGAPARTCFICNEPAAVCVSRKRHSHGEIRRYVSLLREQMESEWKQREEIKESQ